MYRYEFKEFVHRFGYLTMDRAIEIFSIFGGVEGEISLNLSEDIDTIMRGQFCQNYHKFRELIEPSYLLGKEAHIRSSSLEKGLIPRRVGMGKGLSKTIILGKGAKKVREE